MKMLNISKTTIGAAVLSALLLSTSAFAKHGGERGEGFHGKPPMHHFAKALDLTDTQKEQIKQILESAKASKKDNKQSMHDYHVALRSLIESDAYSDEAVKALYLQYQTTFTEQQVQRASIEHQINAVLTAEQLEKKKQLAEKFKHKKEKFREKRLSE